MPTVKEQFDTYLATVPQQSSLSTIDLMKLPAAMRQTMRWIMRNQQMSFQELQHARNELPAAKRMTEAELEESLSAFCEVGWLISEGQGANTIYRANFGQRAGLSPSRRAEAQSKSQGSIFDRIRSWITVRR